MNETKPNAELCGVTASNDPWECVLGADHPGRHCDANGDAWNTGPYGHKYGRPDLYEITWVSGHIETVRAHQVTWPGNGIAMANMFRDTRVDTGPPRIQMHAEIDGRWCLTLSAREEDIRTIRLVTDAEQIPGGAS